MCFFNILKKKYKKNIICNESMANLTTWKIGGITKFLIFPKTKKDLIMLLNVINKYKIKYYVLGKGSNVLIGDKFYDGVLIYLGKKYTYFKKIKKGLYVQSGLSLNKLGDICKRKKYEKIEFLRGIPGTVGGALITNAEAHGISIGNFVKNVFVWHKGEVKTFTKKECEFSYRSSIFNKLKNFVIIAIELEFKVGKKETIEKNYKYVIEFRKKNQHNYPNAGSIFKNHSDNYYKTGYLIDKLGLKGLKKNKVMISEKHGNFILNLGGGKAKDVLILIKKIKKEIKNNYGIELDLEINKFNC